MCKNLRSKDDICFKKNINSWKLRNDSSGVSEILCPKHFNSSSNCISLSSMPNVLNFGKIQISPKKCFKWQNLEYIHRKPVKECYCNYEVKRILSPPARSQHVQQCFLCSHCKSYLNLSPMTAKEKSENHVLKPQTSCETLKRMHRIDYVPRSQFLRNVQSKVSPLENPPIGDGQKVWPKLPCYHKLVTKQCNIQDGTLQCKVETGNVNSKSIRGAEISKHFESTNSLSTYEEGCTDTHKFAKKGNVSVWKQSKPKHVVKKTLSSTKSVPELKKNISNAAILSKNKLCSHLADKKCSYKIMSEKSFNPLSYESVIKYHGSEYCDKTSCKDYDNLNENEKGHFLLKEVKNLKKFRDQNYFDTHGSGEILFSSKSSGSPEQYLLNDRLFPQTIGKIHEKDVVVAIPFCTTLQRNQVHYFPRYIVQQERNNANTNYQKKHCYRCPLTGHATDLGVSKLWSPINSLALKYQKRLP